MEKLLGIFITEDTKLVILEKTMPTIQLTTEYTSVKELRYMEKEFPNLIQRHEINLIGDNPDVPNSETRSRI